MPGHTYVGTVLRTGLMNKTITVQVTRYSEHPKYLKTLTNKIKFHVHDEHEVARPGDLVTIIHTGQPISKWKSFRLLEIDRRGKDRAAYPEIEEGKAVILTEIGVKDLKALKSGTAEGKGEIEAGGAGLEGVEASRDTPTHAEGRI